MWVQGFKDLVHPPLLWHTTSGAQEEQAGLQQALTWDPGITSGALTHCAMMPAPVVVVFVENCLY